jgi:hypothetical protein
VARSLKDSAVDAEVDAVVAGWWVNLSWVLCCRWNREYCRHSEEVQQMESEVRPSPMAAQKELDSSRMVIVYKVRSAAIVDLATGVDASAQGMDMTAAFLEM